MTTFPIATSVLRGARVARPVHEPDINALGAPDFQYAWEGQSDINSVPERHEIHAGSLDVFMGGLPRVVRTCRRFHLDGDWEDIPDEPKIVDALTYMPSIPTYPHMWVEWRCRSSRYAAAVLKVGYYEDDEDVTGDDTENWHSHAYVFQASVDGRLGYSGMVDMHWNDDAVFTDSQYYESGSPNSATWATLQRANDALVTAFMFSHCKGGDVVERLPPRHERRQAQREGLPVLKFHEIVIDPDRPRVVGGGAADGQQPESTMPRHFVRGHFALYTKERPLFGKYVGPVYHRPHARGSLKNGLVKSTYRVKAGTP